MVHVGAFMMAVAQLGIIAVVTLTLVSHRFSLPESERRELRASFWTAVVGLMALTFSIAWTAVWVSEVLCGSCNSQPTP